jgi:hypothetical protein
MRLRIVGHVLVDEKDCDVVLLAESVEGSLNILDGRHRVDNEEIAEPIVLHLADAGQQEPTSWSRTTAMKAGMPCRDKALK